MKTTLFALLFLCATAALGQGGLSASALSNEAQMITIPSHDLHAAQTSMQEERNLLITASNVSAHGERPLWEVGAKPAPQVPLGDVARLYRTQRTTKKAVMVLEQ